MARGAPDYRRDLGIGSYGWTSDTNTRYKLTYTLSNVPVGQWGMYTFTPSTTNNIIITKAAIVNPTPCVCLHGTWYSTGWSNWAYLGSDGIRAESYYPQGVVVPKNTGCFFLALNSNPYVAAFMLELEGIIVNI